MTTKLEWHAHFEDTGCRYSPTCQTCPLPKCKHDMANGELARWLRLERHALIMRVFCRNADAQPGLPLYWLEILTSREVGVSQRTVAKDESRGAPNNRERGYVMRSRNTSPQRHR